MKKGPFKMKGFSGFGNSPTKKIVGGGTGEKFKKGKTYSKSIGENTVQDAYGNKPTIQGSAGPAYDKAAKTAKKADAAAQAYATRPHRTPKAKSDKMLSKFNTLANKADKQTAQAIKQKKIFDKGMSIQRKRMAIDKPKAKKSGGKIKQTPKPTTTQKIKNFLGL
jgi:hypothetical protein